MSVAPLRFNHWIWIGPAVTFAGFVSYFLVFARFPGLRDFPWVNLPLVLAGMAVSTLGLVRAFSRRSPIRSRIFSTLGLLASLAIGVFFLVYVFSLTYTLPTETAVTRGLTVAPDFRLVDQDGEAFALEDFRGSRVVLTFYRGHW